MRRSASEIVRNLEQRIARLERQASHRVATTRIDVTIFTGGPRNKKKKMTLKELFEMIKDQADISRGRCVCNIVTAGSQSKVNFICHNGEWSCSVNMWSLYHAIETDHYTDLAHDIESAMVMDDEDPKEIARVLDIYLGTSRGNYGGGLGRSWLVEVI